VEAARGAPRSAIASAPRGNVRYVPETGRLIHSQDPPARPVVPDKYGIA